jgi:hypothetical protein
MPCHHCPTSCCNSPCSCHFIVSISPDCRLAIFANFFSGANSTHGLVRVKGNVSYIVLLVSLIHALLGNNVLMVFFCINLSKAGSFCVKKLSQTGEPGIIITVGQGQPHCKNALLSVFVNRAKEGVGSVHHKSFKSLQSIVSIIH